MEGEERIISPHRFALLRCLLPPVNAALRAALCARRHALCRFARDVVEEPWRQRPGQSESESESESAERERERETETERQRDREIDLPPPPLGLYPEAICGISCRARPCEASSA